MYQSLPQTSDDQAAPPAIPAPSLVRARWLAKATLALLLALLAVGFIRYLGVLHQTIFYPYELDYGEGIVWAQMREIVAGRGYRPIDAFPSIVFMYPPFYHLLSAAFAGLTGIDQLAAGRLVSAVSTIATAGTIGAIVTGMVKADGGGRLSWLCGMIGGLLVFSMMPVLHWSRFMRIDMLAVLLSFAGLYFGLCALKAERNVHVAALCFVAAVFTRQTSLAAPAAVFATLLLLRPRTAWLGIATCLVAGLLLVGLAQWLTDGGFIEQIIFLNVNRAQLGRLSWIATMASQHAPFICIACFAIGQRIYRVWPQYRHCSGFDDFRRTLARNGRDSQFLMVAAYFVLATPMLLTIVKVGSAYNYFLEWLCIVALFVGLALRDTVVLASTRISTVGQSSLLAVAVPLIVAFQAFMLPDLPADSWRMNVTRRVELDRLFQMIRAAPKPVSSDEMVMLVRAGKPLQWEPAMYAELGTVRLWDQRPMLDRVRHGYFSFIVTGYGGKGAVYDGCYSQAFADAIAVGYPVRRNLGGYTIRFPAGKPAS